jgi:hypothetical protein
MGDPIRPSATVRFRGAKNQNSARGSGRVRIESDAQFGLDMPPITPGPPKPLSRQPVGGRQRHYLGAARWRRLESRPLVTPLLQPDPPGQLAEAWVLAQRSIAGIDLEIDQARRARLERSLQ